MWKMHEPAFINCNNAIGWAENKTAKYEVDPHLDWHESYSIARSKNERTLRIIRFFFDTQTEKINDWFH